MWGGKLLASSRIGTIFAAGAAGLDINAADSAANNAVKNNAIRHRFIQKNKKALETAKALHDKIKEKTGLGDDEFWIDGTGGDRYLGEDGQVYSSTTGEIVEGSGTGSPHLDKNGARGYDFTFSENISPELVKEILVNELGIYNHDKYPDEGSNYIGYEHYPKEPHIHFNLLKGDGYNPNNTSPDPKDYEVLPDDPVFWTVPKHPVFNKKN